MINLYFMSFHLYSIESISFISFLLMFFFTTMEMAKISEYNLLDCVIRFGGVKKSTIFFGSLWFAGAEAYIRESISNRGEIMSELSFSHLFFCFCSFILENNQQKYAT